MRFSTCEVLNVSRVWLLVLHACVSPRVWFSTCVVFHVCRSPLVWFYTCVVFQVCGFPSVWLSTRVVSTCFNFLPLQVILSSQLCWNVLTLPMD